MKKKMMHDGLGSGPLLNVGIGIGIWNYYLRPQHEKIKNIHHHVFCVLYKHIFFCTNYEEDDDHYPLV